MNGIGTWRPVWVTQAMILDRRTWVYYLTIPMKAVGQLAERFEVRPDARFFEVTNKLVTAYIDNGELPPDEVTSAVMNIADDVVAGRDVVIRAGDYISLQNFARLGK